MEQRGKVVDELTEYLDEKLYGRAVDLEELRSQASVAIDKSQSYNERYFQEHHKPAVEFEVGEYVAIRNVDTVVGTNKKLLPKYRGPYVITKS